MKRIVGVFALGTLALGLASAQVWVEGRGYVETNVVDYNYTKSAGAETHATSLFNNWDTGDSDIWVKGDWEGKGGFNLNVTFDDVGKGNAPAIGDWTVWVRPVDFLTFKASNEAYRLSNRYNTAIDKLESKIGVLNLRLNQTGYSASAFDDDAFKGFILNLDFNIIKIDLGFNPNIALSFDTESGVDFKADAAGYFQGNTQRMGAGARVFVPLQGLLNLDIFAKYYYNSVHPGTSSAGANYTFNASALNYGVIADIIVLPGMGLSIGYLGHLTDLKNHTGPLLQAAAAANGSQELTQALDIRFQLNSGPLVVEVHNNATAALELKKDAGISNALFLADKLNVGVGYNITETFTIYSEIQNYFTYKKTTGISEKNSGIRDYVTVYPRFALQVVPQKVTLCAGIRADFDVYSTQTITNENGTTSGNAPAGVKASLPLSIEVLF